MIGASTGYGQYIRSLEDALFQFTQQETIGSNALTIWPALATADPILQFS